MSEPTTPTGDTTTEAPAVETQAVAPAEQTDQATETLGDSGKAALTAERKARREAEKRAADFEKRLTAFEDAQKSEAEKLADRATKAEQRAAEIEARFKAGQITQALTTAAITAQAIDIDAVLALAKERGGIEVDDVGTVTGADKTIATLLREKPHLFRTAPPGHRDAAAGSPPPALNSDALTDALSRAVGAK
jgi:hypothetical protein